MTPRMAEGSSMNDLTDDGIILDVAAIEDHDVEVGETVTVTRARRRQLDLEIQGFSDDLHAARRLHHHPRHLRDDRARARSTSRCSARSTRAPTSTQVMADVEEATSATPAIEVLDKDGFIGSIVDQITLVRHGDLRAPRAVDHHRPDRDRQHAVPLDQRADPRARPAPGRRHEPPAAASASIRWEAVIISVLGALVGIGIGIVLSWALVTSLEGLRAEPSSPCRSGR